MHKLELGKMIRMVLIYIIIMYVMWKTNCKSMCYRKATINGA